MTSEGSAGPNPPRASGGPWLPVLIALAYLALIVPVLIVDTPPVLDYANHTARLWMIAGGDKIAALQQMYVIDWSRTSTNIGIDLLAATVGPLVGRDHIGPLCLILAILLAPVGALMLNRRIFGGAHWWQFTFVLPVFGKTLLSGFMNFHVGAGLALIAAALDDRLARLGPVPAFIGRLLLTSVVLTFHPFAALGYGGLLLGLAIGRDVAPLLSWKGLGSKIVPGILAVLPTVVPVLLVMIFSPHPPVAVGQATMSWNPFSLGRLAGDLLVAFHSYSNLVDGLVVLALVATVGLAAVTRRISIHAGLLLAGIAFMAVTVVMPTQIGDGYYLQYRLPVIAAFTLLAAVRPEFASWRPVTALLATLFFALAIGRTAWVGAAWISAQQDVRSMRQALAAAPEGASILPMSHWTPEDQRGGAPFGRYFGDTPAYWGYPPVAVMQRHAFIPTLFGIVGQQPLTSRGRYIPLSMPNGDNPPPIATLHAASHPASKQYLDHWRSFDYILLLNADAPAGPQDTLRADDAVLVSDQGFARLYRVLPAPRP